MNREYNAGIDAMRYCSEAWQQLREEVLRSQEEEIIRTAEEARQITKAGFNSTIETLKKASAINATVLIANAATAAAIRKAVANIANVEIIVCKAVETSVVYKVTDENLKYQLLESIRGKGSIHHGNYSHN